MRQSSTAGKPDASARRIAGPTSDDAAYFSKFFSRSVGHTPSDYRALVAKGVMGAVGPA